MITNETIYEFVGGMYHGMIFGKEDMKIIGNGKLSKNWSKERENGGVVPREELDNQPLVDGYLSPMYDGVRYRMDDGKLEYDFRLSDADKVGKEPIIVLRYETQEVYDLMSN